MNRTVSSSDGKVIRYNCAASSIEDKYDGLRVGQLTFVDRQKLHIRIIELSPFQAIRSESRFHLLVHIQGLDDGIDLDE